ncbi:hypothetical protein NL318_27990, partial [Klebsiella pneumoniae]|nr:hypothetical protein [Klebsiella pneumoniae]
AQLALQAQILATSTLSKSKQSQIATMVGATDLSTGKTTVAMKKKGENYGKCAEDLAVEQLGANKVDVVFTKAYRPRTQENIAVCKR